jgi:hypothetical protein
MRHIKTALKAVIKQVKPNQKPSQKSPLKHKKRPVIDPRQLYLFDYPETFTQNQVR